MGGKLLLVPCAPDGPTYAHVQDWVGAQPKGLRCKDISATVLVKGIKQWAAYQTTIGAKPVRTVFKIT